MADRQDSDREVLTSLPRSRPVRRSAKRAARPDAAAAAAPKSATASKGSAKAGKAGAKAAAKPKATAKPKTAAAAPRPKPKAAARPTPAPAAEPAAARAGRPPRKVPPAGYASPVSDAEHARDGGSPDLVTNAIEAAAELAQIGFAVGRQALQSMLDRLPKP